MSNGQKHIPSPEEVFTERQIPSPSDVFGDVKKKDEPSDDSLTQQSTSNIESGFRTAFEKGQQPIDKSDTQLELEGKAVSDGEAPSSVWEVEPEPDFDPTKFEYIMESGATNSLTVKGVMFLSMMDEGFKLNKKNPMGYARDQMQKLKTQNEERWAGYDPSIPEHIAAGLVSLFLDAGPFRGASAISGRGVNIASKGARWVKSKLVKSGVAKKVADIVVKKSIITEILQRGAQTGGTLGLYGAGQDAMNQLEDSSVEDFDTWRTMKTFGKDFLIGVPVGGIGALGGRAGSVLEEKLIDKGINSFISKASGGAVEYLGFTPAEAAVFQAGGSLIPDPSTGERHPFTVEGWASDLGVVTGAKIGGRMSRASENFRPEKAGKNEFSVEFSVDELNRLSRGEKIGITGEEAIRRIAKDADYRSDVMNNPEVAFTTKAKLMWASEGVESMESPQAFGYEVKESPDGRASLETRDLNGNVIERAHFTDKRAARKAASEVDAAIQESNILNTIDNFDVKNFSSFDYKLREAGLEGGLDSGELASALHTIKGNRTIEQDKIINKLIKVYEEFEPIAGKETIEKSVKKEKVEYESQEGELKSGEKIDIVPEKTAEGTEFVAKNKEGERLGRVLIGEAAEGKTLVLDQATEKAHQKKGVMTAIRDYMDKQGVKALTPERTEEGQAFAEATGRAKEPTEFDKFKEQRKTEKMGVGVPKGVTRQTWDRLMKARGILPKDVFQSWIRYGEGAPKSQMFEIEMMQRRFRDAASESYKGKLDKAELERINNVLKNLGTGDEQAAMLQQLPEPMREVVGEMRDQIDALSREMLRMGMIDGDLIGKFDRNLGFYATRRYKAHNEKRWTYENIPKETMNRAWNFMRKEYPKWSEDRIEGELKSMLKDPDSPLGFLKSSKLGAKDLGVLNLRKNIPVELRDFLGEYKDPLYNYASSVYRMADLIGRENFLRDVKDMGMDRFLFKDKTATHYRPIAAEGSRVMEPLNGLYTTPELARAFEGFNKSQAWSHWALVNYAKLNSAVKYGKTIASPQTHIRNYQSNYILQLANGRFFMKGGETKDLFRFAYGKKGRNDPVYKEYVKGAIERGVLRDNARLGEMFDVIQDAHKSLNDFDKATDTWANKPLKRMNKFAQKAYQLEDDVHKLYAYGTETDRYMKVYERKHPEKPVDEVREMAMDKAGEIVRNTLPTYSLVPEFLKQVRRLPVTGTFISFPAEIIRTTWNTADIAIKEMKDPDTRAIGATRMSGLLAAAGLTYGLERGSLALFGLTKEDGDDMRKFRPPWSKNSQSMIVSEMKDGVYSEVDMAFSDPLNYIKNAANAVMYNSDNLDEAWRAGLNELISPFAEEELLMSKLLDVARNTHKETRQPVYNEDHLMGDKIAASIKYLWDDLQPGVFASGERIIKGAKGTKEGGREYSFKEEVLANMLGFRISRRNTGQSFMYHVNDWGKRLDQTRFDYIKVLNKANVKDSEIDRAYAATDAAFERIIMEAHEDYKAAVNLGVPRKELMKHLKNLNNDFIAGMIITGRYVSPPKQTGRWSSGRTGQLKPPVKDESSPTQKHWSLPTIEQSRGKEVAMNVEIEETGKKARMKLSALEVRKDIKRRYTALDKLTEAIG